MEDTTAGGLDEDIRLANTTSSPTAAWGTIHSAATHMVTDLQYSSSLDAPGEYGWFKIALAHGYNHTFNVSGLSTNDGTLYDPVVEIFNSDGRRVGGDNNSGTGLNSLLTLYLFTESGIYYARIRSGNKGTGTYQITTQKYSDPILYDNTVRNGYLSSSEASNWWKLYLQEGETYTFHMRGASTDDGTLIDPAFSIMDEFNNRLASNNNSGSGSNAKYTFKAFTGGTYYLKAISNDYGLEYGTYEVESIHTPDAILTIGVDLRGEVENQERDDWIKTNLDYGKTYTFELSGVGSLSNPYMELYDESGNLLIADNDSGEGLNAKFTHRANHSGVYYINARASSYGSGTYTLSSSEAPDPTLAAGSTLSGDIGTVGEMDWFQVALAPAQTYTFTLNGASTAEGTLADPLLGLFDAEGNTIMVDDNDGTGTNASITVKIPGGGTYYLGAQANGIGTGTYTIGSQLTTDPELAINSTIHTDLAEAYEQDWYQVNLTAGVTYRFAMNEDESGGNPLWDTYLELYSTDGQLLVENDDIYAGYSWMNSALFHTPTQSGTYYLKARSYDDETGDYELISATDPLLAIGSTVNGTVESSFTGDWYRVDMVAGQTYRFEMKGSELGDGTLADPYLTLFDASGEWIAYDDDNGAGYNADMVYTATETGTLYLWAGACWDETGTYVLTSSIGTSSTSTGTADDHGNTLSSASALALGTVMTGVLEAAGDRDTFAVHLEQGVTYDFAFAGGGTGSTEETALHDAFVNLYDTQGAKLLASGSIHDHEHATALSFTATEGGQYFLSVERGKTGAYTLMATPA